MMNARTKMQLLAVIAAGTAMLSAGCSEQRSTETVGQKVDRAADTIASKTDQVTAKTAAAVDDAAITTKVKAAVLAEPGLKTLDISVDTKEGVVTLAGTVNSPELKDRAMQLAQGVEGVRSVADQLVVKSS
jgi:hyperosmotically inducible protein